jgi:F-type H+-transporting ATPase subunit a
MMALLSAAGDRPFSIVSFAIEALHLPESWSHQYIDVVMSILMAILITVMSVMVWRRIRNTEQNLLPDSRLTLTNALEMIVEILLRLMGNVMTPEEARRHMVLIGPLFLYLLILNTIGVLPGVNPPTENINTNMACAIVVFLYYNYYGIKTQGLRNYLKHMAGPVVWLAPLLFAIEIVSHLVRPLSLSVRLMGNIAGDHMVLEIFSGLVPLFLPIVFIALAIFISILQAFVFTLLSIIYIQMASAPEGH